MFRSPTELDPDDPALGHCMRVDYGKRKELSETVLKLHGKGRKSE
jgi:hypothetical protein